MAMVNIKRGRFTTRVSKDAYEKYFKSKGYSIIKSDENTKQTKNDVEENEKALDVKETDEVSSDIPISDMNSKQLRKYAEENGIDVSEAKSAENARSIIRKALKERNM